MTALTWQPTPTAAILDVQIAEWNGTAQVWRDVGTFIDPADLKLAWTLDGFTAEGSLRLQVPLASDIYAFEAWNEVRISSTTANNPVGGYSRYFRGFISRYTSTTDTEALLKIYDFTLVGPGTLLDIPTSTFIGLRTYQGTDQEIVHALAAYALPELYPSGVTTPNLIPSTPTTSLYSAGSALAAGTYTLAIAWANPVGAGVAGKKSVTLTAGQGVHVTIPTFPTGVTQAVVYMSRAVNDSNMLEQGRAYAPGTYNLTTLGTGAADNLTNQMGPYPTVPADQPVNNYSTVQTPTYGRLQVDIENMTLREALVAVQKAVPADYEVPAFTLLWQWDNSAHTADWRFQLMWLRDSDRPISSFVLNDSGSEDSTHANYYGYSRVRDGQAVRNVQPVLGAWIGASNRQAQSTTTSSVSYTQIGRYLAAKPVVDTSLTADSDCAARGRQEIDKIKLVAETVSQVTTLVPYFTIGSQLGCNRLQIRRTTEGGMDAVLDADLPIYVIGRVALDFDAEGIAGYTLELGTSFAELGERPSGFRGGTTTTQDTVPPPVPDWYGDSRDIVSNAYSGATRTVTLVVTWAPDTTSQDLSYYETQFSLDGGTTWRDPQRTDASGVPTATYSGLPYTDPTTGAAPAATLRLRATDTHGNASAWGTPRAAIALASRDYPAAPVWDSAYTATPISTTQGTALLTWTDGAGGSGTITQWRVMMTDGGSDMQFIVTARTILLTLLLGVSYTTTVQAGTAYNDWGTISSGKSVVVNHDAPGPPTLSITGITPAVSDRGGAGILLSIAKPTTGTGLSRIARYEVAGDWRDGLGTVVGKVSQFYTYTGDPTTGSLLGLTAGRTYHLRVVALTLYGDIGTVSSDILYTIPVGLNRALYDPDFEIPSTDDATKPDGWTPAIMGGTYTYARDTTVFRTGAASLKITLLSTDAALSLASDYFTVIPGQRVAVRMAYKSDDATLALGFGATLLFFNSAGSTVPPTIGLSNNVDFPRTGTGWESGQGIIQATIPDGAVQARLLVGCGGGGTTGGTHAWIDSISVQPAATYAAGDLVQADALGAPDRLAPGSTGQVLTIVSGLPAWQTPSGGPLTDPQAAHAFLGGPSTGTTAPPAYRLLVGADLPPEAVKNPMGAQDDLIIGGTSGTPVVLHKGSNGTYLAVNSSGHLAWIAEIMSLNLAMGDGVNVLTTGDKGVIEVHFPCTIIAADLLADASSSAVVNIYKQAFGSYTGWAGVTTSIVASAKPTLSSAARSSDSTLTGWTTSLAAGDVLKISVESATTLTALSLILKVQRS